MCNGESEKGLSDLPSTSTFTTSFPGYISPRNNIGMGKPRAAMTLSASDGHTAC